MTDNHLNRRIDDKRDTRQLQWVDQPDALHPDYQKALRTRDELEDQIARCGAQLLDMLGVGGFLVPIPCTNPVQYVAAGTLEMIGNVMQYAPGSAVSTAVGEAVATDDLLTDERIAELAEREADEMDHGYIFNKDGRFSVISFARAIEREAVVAYRERSLAAPTQVSAPQADATQAAQVVWVSIDDRLPEDGDEVMICGDRHEEGKYQAVAKHSHGSFYDDDHNEEGEYINVTHWMSLLAEPGEVDAPQAGQEAQASAPQEVRAVPEGWKRVPIEPTQGMLNAGAATFMGGGLPLAIYANMLRAAPDTPASTSTAPAAMDEKGADHE